MIQLVDISAFPVGDLGYDVYEEIALIGELEKEARRHVESRPWAPPIAEIIFAFGLGPIIGLFLIRFTQPLRDELEGETEMWIVVGDLPTIIFDTEMTPTPALALELYCAIAEHWAEMILTGGDLSECYPIAAAPTREHAKMLNSRITTLRRQYIPAASLEREPKP